MTRSSCGKWSEMNSLLNNISNQHNAGVSQLAEQLTLNRFMLECYQHRPITCRTYFHEAGKRKRKRSLRRCTNGVGRAHKCYSLRRLLRLGVIQLRFCEFFGE